MLHNGEMKAIDVCLTRSFGVGVVVDVWVGVDGWEDRAALDTNSARQTR